MTVSTDKKARSGFKKKLAINVEEASVVTRIFSWSAFGENGRILGMKSIAQKLSDQKIKRRGRNWTQQDVHRVLHNSAYVGRYVTFQTNARTRERYPPQEHITTEVPAIIDQQLFDHVQELLGKRQISNPAAKAEQAVSLLTGLAKCGSCGAPLMIMSGKSGQYRYYRCAGKQKTGVSICDCPNVPQAVLESSVLETVADVLLDPAAIVDALGRVNAVAAARRQHAQQDIMILAREKGAHQEKLQRLYEGISEGKLALDGHLAKIVDGHERRTKAVEEEIRLLERDREVPLRKISHDHAIRFGEHARATLSDPRNPLVRPYLRALVSEIVISTEKVTLKALTCLLSSDHGELETGALVG